MKQLRLSIWRGSSSAGNPDFYREWGDIPAQVPPFFREESVNWVIRIPWLFGWKITLAGIIRVEVA